MKYGYYPGCSLERNARAYHDSILAIASCLGLELAEVDDWNCCGATEYFTVDLLGAYSLVARNLALAALDPEKKDLVAPCSACYLNLAKTDHHLRESHELADKVNQALAAGGLHYQPGSIKTRHLLDVIVNDIGIAAVANQVKKPLNGLRVAPYYGCLIVRPGFDGLAGDNPEYPTALDVLLQALGSEIVDFPMKAHCCGGHMTQISENTALELIRRLLKSASDYRADVIATLCPMCQLNLDAYQYTVNKYFDTDYHIPILYFTQILGLAFGKPPKELGIGREIVDAGPALARIGVEMPAEEKEARVTRGKQDQQELPMPSRL